MVSRYKSLIFSILLLASMRCQLIRFPLENRNEGKQQSHNNFRNLEGGTSLSTLQKDTAQYITVNIGSQNKAFPLLLDTGSDTLWVYDLSLSKEVGESFDCSKSTTCIARPSNDIRIQYGSGTVEGYWISEQVTLNNITVPRFNMVLVNNIDQLPIPLEGGILGLSLTSKDGRTPTVLDSLKRNGLLDIRTFSMYLGKGSGPGELILGGHDPKYAKTDFKFVQVRGERESIHWETTLTSLSYGSKNSINGINGYPAIFDSGTSELMLPKSVIDQIKAKISSQFTSVRYEGERIVFNCNWKDLLDDLVFEFNGVTLKVPPSSYVKTLSGICFISMMPLEKLEFEAPIILGVPFLKNYYTLYTADNHTVGFAEVNFPPSGIFAWPLWAQFLLLISICVAILLLYRKIRKDGYWKSEASSPFLGLTEPGIVIGGTEQRNENTNTRLLHPSSSSSPSPLPSPRRDSPFQKFKGRGVVIGSSENDANKTPSQPLQSSQQELAMLNTNDSVENSML